MVYVLALLIFVAPAVCWFVSVACYRSTVAGSDPADAPDYPAAAAAIGVASLTSFVPFPFGYVAGLVVWGVAAFGGLGLSAAGRAAVLFLDLAASSFVARLVVLGAIDVIGN